MGGQLRSLSSSQTVIVSISRALVRSSPSCVDGTSLCISREVPLIAVNRDIEFADIDDFSEGNITRTIIFYANQMASRPRWLTKYVFLVWRFDVTHLSQVQYEDIGQDLMLLIGIVGVEDPLREGARKAVEDCQKASVAMKICTGDNVLTARSIATKCGIFMAGGIIMEGPVFRLLEALGLFDYIVVLYS